MGESGRSPLAEKRVVITRAASQCEAFANALAERGASTITLPLIVFCDPDDFGPLDAALLRLREFDWLIFTSGEAVRAVAKRCDKLGQKLAQSWSGLKVAAVGPVTAEAIEKAGLQVDYIAQDHNGAALANELKERVRGKKVLLPRSDLANPDLPLTLRQHGAEVTEAIAYRTLRPTDIQREELKEYANGKADAIVFFSPSAVVHFSGVFGRERLHEIEGKLAITAVGPVTARALREAGVERMAIAKDTTAMAVITALEKYFARAPKRSTAGAQRR